MELERERLVTTAFIGGKPYIVTGDQTATIRIYDAGTGKPVAELPGMIVASAITETTLDERSGLLAIADDDGRAVVVVAVRRRVILDRDAGGRAAQRGDDDESLDRSHVVSPEKGLQSSGARG